MPWRKNWHQLEFLIKSNSAFILQHGLKEKDMEHLNLAEVSSFIIPLVIAITMHEAAHGFVADMLGDNTARIMGRVTFNPFRHVDLFGTIILPGLLIFSGSPVLGWAKPVPVNFSNLRNWRYGSISVALAGPLTNIILGFISAIALHIDLFITPEQAPWVFMNLYNSVYINIILAVFNLLPILPLDGGRVLNALLPYKIARIYSRSERFGMALIFMLFIVAYFLRDLHIADINPGYYLIYLPADFLRDIILHLSGIGNTQ